MNSPISIGRFEDATIDPLNARFFPAEAYISEEFYRFEREAVWLKEWVCVGRVEEIPNKGDYFSAEIAGEPIIVVRSTETELSAMSAVCRHRAMVLTEGSKGHCKGSFICPYHRWTYGLDGRLLGAPQMGGVGTFDRASLGLPRLALEVWHGLIFVNFDTGAAALAPRLEAVEPAVRDWRLEDLRGEFLKDPAYRQHHDYAWNWKVYAEGQSECYHCDKLHGDTPGMQNIDCSTMASLVQDNTNGVFAFDLQSKVIDATINHIGQAIFPAIPWLTEDQRWLQRSVIIAPNVFMALSPDCVIVLMWWPTGPHSMRVKRHRLYPQETLDRADFVERHKEESVALRHFVGQDNEAFERVQRGLFSRFAPQGPLSSKEFVLFGLNKWLTEKYRGAASVA